MTDELFQTIEDYIEKRLSPEKARAFEQLLDQDMELREAVDLSRKIKHHLSGHYPEENANAELVSEVRSYLDSEEAREYEEKLVEARETYLTSKKKSKKNRIYFFSAAAAAAILILVFNVTLNRQQNADELYAAYFSAKDIPSLVTRNGELSLKSGGVNAFQSGSYQTAIDSFNLYLERSDVIDPMAYLYLGNSYLELKKYNESIDAFNRLIQSQSLDSSRGLWFKALAYVKQNKIKSAKTTLRQLIDDPSGYKNNEAKALLKAL